MATGFLSQKLSQVDKIQSFQLPSEPRADPIFHLKKKNKSFSSLKQIKKRLEIRLPNCIRPSFIPRKKKKKNQMKKQEINFPMEP